MFSPRDADINRKGYDVIRRSAPSVDRIWGTALMKPRGDAPLTPGHQGSEED